MYTRHLHREGRPACIPVLRSGRESRVYLCSAWGGEAEYTRAFEMKNLPPFKKFKEAAYTCAPLKDGKACIPVLSLGRKNRVYESL